MHVLEIRRAINLPPDPAPPRLPENWPEPPPLPEEPPLPMPPPLEPIEPPPPIEPPLPSPEIE